MSNMFRINMVTMLLHILMLIISGSNSASIIYPPTIETDTSGDIIIKAGENLSLTCTGDVKLKWEFANVSDIMQRTKISETIQEKDNMKMHISKLFIVNTVYSDSGFITCHYDGSDLENLQEKIENSSSTYVYVFDPEKLFLPVDESTDEIIILHIQKHKEFIFPCRPSHPNVNVTLLNSEETVISSNTGRKALAFQTEDISYDSRVGFRIRYPNNFFTSLFECDAVYKNVSQKLELHLIWSDDKINSPIPYIDGGDSDILVNQTLQLTCSAYADPGESLIMNWMYPSSRSLRIIESETEIIDKSRNDDYKYRIFRKKLTVEDVQLSDQGYYNCSVTNLKNRTSYRENFTNIFPIQPPFLTPLSNMDGSVLSVQSSKIFELVCGVRGLPRPHITWYKDGQLLNESGNGWLKFSSWKNRLKITSMQKEDAAVYVCVAENSGGKVSANVTLKISEDVNLLLKEREEASSNFPLIIFVVILAIVLIIIIVLVILKFMKKSQ